MKRRPTEARLDIALPEEETMAMQATSAIGDTPMSILARTPVRAAMQLGLFQCEPDADLRALAGEMAERRIHALVVRGLTGPDGPLGGLRWGIVSDLDLIRALRAGPPGMTAGELASTAPVRALPTDTLEHAAALMSEHGIAHLVVVSPQTGRPVGMLSTLDIARAAARDEPTPRGTVSAA
jgi:CBS domain-containing protein